MDGSYNMTIIANDSLNNVNNSAVLEMIIFDNSAPVIIHSCDDYTVEEDDDMDCDCSASDSISGLNLSYGKSKEVSMIMIKTGFLF